MEIAYFGLGCFRLKGKDRTVLLDVSNDALHKTLTKAGNAVLVDTKGMSDPAQLRDIDAPVQRIAGAGEFEVGGIEVKGIQTSGGTTMVVTIDDVRCVTLGMTHTAPNDAELDALGHVDVLFVPAGGDRVLTAQEAVAVVRQVEPAVAIPMYYRVEAVPEAAHFNEIELFAKESGLESVSPLAKLSVTPTVGGDELTTATVILDVQK